MTAAASAGCTTAAMALPGTATATEDTLEFQRAIIHLVNRAADCVCPLCLTVYH